MPLTLAPKPMTETEAEICEIELELARYRELLEVLMAGDIETCKIWVKSAIRLLTATRAELRGE